MQLQKLATIDQSSKKNYPKDWEVRSIESLCLKVTSGGTPYRKNEAFYTNGTVRWIKTKELKDAYIYDSEEKITDEAIEKSSAKIFPPNTVLMAMYGDGRTITSLGILGKEASTNQACCGFITDPKVCYFRFLFYSLMYYRNELLNLALGGAQRNLSAKVIKNFVIKVPTLSTQRKIAAILSAYDDLIENNARRIKILEEMASALYREWFVNFRFPGHEKVRMEESELGPKPEGWEVRKILDLSYVTYGFPFKSKQFNSEGVGKPIVRIRDVLAGTSDTFTTEEAGEKYLIKNGDILVGMDGDFHMGFWVGGSSYLVQRVARFRSKGSIGRYHLFLALRNPIRDFDATITGTTVAHLGDKHIKTIKIIWPTERVRNQFNNYCDIMLDQILNLRLRNQLLSRTRDYLLPKLISGEIDVESLEIKVGGLEA